MTMPTMLTMLTMTTMKRYVFFAALLVAAVGVFYFLPRAVERRIERERTAGEPTLEATGDAEAAVSGAGPLRRSRRAETLESLPPRCFSLLGGVLMTSRSSLTRCLGCTGSLATSSRTSTEAAGATLASTIERLCRQMCPPLAPSCRWFAAKNIA